MLKTIRDLVLGVAAAVAGAFAGIFGLTHYLREDEPDEGSDQKARGAAGAGSRQEAKPGPEARPAEPPTLPPGWTLANPETLARPTYWPVVMAAGITLIMWGIGTTFLLSAVGLLLFALALAGWIADILNEGNDE